jgi:bacillithiol biosynthesis deacetylase BshB1
MTSDSPTIDYLIVAAHPDDAELCVGGAILSLKANGAKVGVLDLTSGEPTPHGSVETRQRETDAATALLGLDWRGNLGLANRSLVSDLESRKLLAGVLRQLRPRVLITHYWEDAHPDHVAASALVDAARFWAKLTKTDMPGEPHYPAKILYFPSMHLPMHVKPSFVLDVSAFHERKLQAIRCYHSQFIAGRSETPPTLFDDINARARYFGWTIGAMYGEPFLSRQEIGVRNLQQLV